MRQAYQSYDYERALNNLETPDVAGSEIDELLYLLDKGMILHSAGRFKESTQVLGKADRLADQINFVSVSEQAVTLIKDERSKVYRGEDFERLLINIFQALNYAQLGKEEDALVEVRRCNERLRKMVHEDKKPYEHLAIARYLGGVFYEDQEELDSAFIDYYKAYELEPDLGYLLEPLIRLAKKLDRPEAYKELREKYPSLSDEPLGRGEGEVVVVMEVGLSPQKESSEKGQGEQLIVVPVYRQRHWARQKGVVRVLGQQEVKAVTVTPLYQVATLHLDDRMGRMIAKQLAGVLAKAAVASAVASATNSSDAGALAFWLLAIANEADTRSWLSLPAELQVARIRLPEGTHALTVRYGGITSRHPVEVEAGRIQVLSIRRY